MAFGFFGALIIGLPLDFVAFNMFVGCPNPVLPDLCSHIANLIGGLPAASALVFYLIAPLLGVLVGVYLSHRRAGGSFSLKMTPEEIANPAADQNLIKRVMYWLLGIIAAGSLFVVLFTHPQGPSLDDWEQWGEVVVGLVLIAFIVRSIKRPSSLS
jgi:preprotein translocase subunit SecG